MTNIFFDLILGQKSQCVRCSSLGCEESEAQGRDPLSLLVANFEAYLILNVPPATTLYSRSARNESSCCRCRSRTMLQYNSRGKNQTPIQSSVLFLFLISFTITFRQLYQKQFFFRQFKWLVKNLGDIFQSFFKFITMN